jgi:hypothetical protein
MITTNTRLVSIGGSLLLLVFIVELVRRRRLKEEYSVLWIATGLVLLLLSVWYSLLVKVTKLIGGVAPSSTLFFFGLLFVMAMLLHFSIRTSQLERRLTAVIQEIGLLTATSAHRDGDSDEVTDRDLIDEDIAAAAQVASPTTRTTDGPRLRA